MLNKLVYVQTHMPRKIVLCWGNGARERETVLWNLARVKEVRLILPTNSSRGVAPAARVHGDGTRTPHGPSHVVTFPYTRPPPLTPLPILTLAIAHSSNCTRTRTTTAATAHAPASATNAPTTARRSRRARSTAT